MGQTANLAHMLEERDKDEDKQKADEDRATIGRLRKRLATFKRALTDANEEIQIMKNNPEINAIKEDMKAEMEQMRSLQVGETLKLMHLGVKLRCVHNELQRRCVIKIKRRLRYKLRIRID